MYMYMLYPIIAVPGRVNGGVPKMFTLMKEGDNPATIDRGPKDVNQLQKTLISSI